MNKTYALRVKLPDGSCVGDLYANDGHGYYNKRLHHNAKGIDEQHRWDTWQVENNPEFFVLWEEERVVIDGLTKHCAPEIAQWGWYQFKAIPHEIPAEKFPAIIKAITDVVNNEKTFHFDLIDNTAFNQSQETAEDIKIQEAVKLVQSKRYYILDPKSWVAYKESSRLMGERKFTEEDLCRKLYEKELEVLCKYYERIGLDAEERIKELEDYIKQLNK